MSNVVEVNEQNFQSEVLEAKTPVLVDFWAPWCGYCRMMAPFLDSISRKLGPDLKVVKLNTDVNKKIQSDYRIQSIPSLLIFQNGKEIDRLIGFTPEAELEEKLKKYLERSSE